MLLPSNIPHTIGCPYCCEERQAILQWQFHPHPGGNKSEYLSYHCDKCKLSFTTTESDTISMKIYHSKKRSVYRKSKISKLGL